MSIKLTNRQKDILTMIYEDGIDGKEIIYYILNLIPSGRLSDDEKEDLINKGLIKEKSDRFFSTDKGKAIFNNFLVTLPSKDLTDDQEEFLYQAVTEKNHIVLDDSISDELAKIITEVKRYGYIHIRRVVKNGVYTNLSVIYPTFEGQAYFKEYLS